MKNVFKKVCTAHGCALVIAAIALGGSSVCAAADSQKALDPINKKLESGEPLVFATFGDSITWPCYHTDYHQNYITFTVAALRQAYPKASVKIVHGGNMGTTGRGLDNQRFEKHVLAYKPDVVFIMFGMNDCGGGQPGLESFDKNLVTLIRKTKDAGALPILATQNEIFYDSRDGRPRTHLPKYMQRTLDVAKRENVPAVDCFALWEPLKDNPKKLASRLNDWIHPNHAGHRLMAKAITQTLWPDAAKFVNTHERTPLQPIQEKATASLLPGPPGKQVLRTAEGMWVAVSGRKRNAKLTDLVFSYCDSEEPDWSEFKHITLVGPRPDAVFDSMDRTLTAGMLLQRDGKIYAVFSWNVGVFMLTIEEPLLGDEKVGDGERMNAFAVWETTLSRPQTWLKHQDQPFVRPTVVANSIYCEGGTLYDAYLQKDGWPALLCAGRRLFSGGGFEIVDGDDGVTWITRPAPNADSQRMFLQAGVQTARCMVSPEGNVFYTAQKEPNSPLILGTLSSAADRLTATANGEFSHFLLPSTGSTGLAVVKKSKGEWAKCSWRTGSDKVEYSVDPIRNARQESEAIPLPWSGEARRGILWWTPSDDSESAPVFAYESQLSKGAKRLGVLSLHDDTLTFQALPLEHVLE